MRKKSIGKVVCSNYPELNQEFEQKLIEENIKDLEYRTYTHEVFEKFKPFLTQAIYGTTECVDPKVRVWAQAGYGFGTENWRFSYDEIMEAAFEYAREKLSSDEYDEVRGMKRTSIGEDLINEHCQDMLEEFYGYKYKIYWSEFYKYFIRDMSLIEEAYFFTFANVAGWGVWLIVKLFIGLPWSVMVFVLYMFFGTLEKIYNFLFKK